MNMSKFCRSSPDFSWPQCISASDPVKVSSHAREVGCWAHDPDLTPRNCWASVAFVDCRPYVVRAPRPLSMKYPIGQKVDNPVKNGLSRQPPKSDRAGEPA